MCEFLRRIIDMAAFNPNIQVKHFRRRKFKEEINLKVAKLCLQSVFFKPNFSYN